MPIGYGERTNYRAGEAIVDVTESGHYVAGQRAFAQSGLGPKDIAALHPYDDFIIAIMMQLEMLGFCKRGQGCGFVNEHDFTYTGDLPLNTGGGQISAGQCGLAGGGTNVDRGGPSAPRRRRQAASQEHEQRSGHGDRRDPLWTQLEQQRRNDPGLQTRERRP